ncbi:MAG: PAS domain-containing protein [Acidaminobacter sp.]|nr:PAS domain-containing protein [Acidaminobacter sp.]
MGMAMRAETLGKLLTPFGAGIIVLDDKQRLLWMNQAVKTFFDTTGRTFKEFFPYEIDLTVDQVVTLHDPEGHQYLISVTKIIDANPCHTVISLQRPSDFNYSATKSYCLETALDQINDGVVISDFEGKIVLYNRAMEQLEERNRSEMVGKFIWDAYGYKDPAQSEHRQVFNSAAPLLDRFSAHVYKNGRPLFTSYSTFPLVKDGERLGVFSICRNDTKLRELLDETIELKKRFFAAREAEDAAGMLPSKPHDFTSLRTPLNNGTHYTFSDIIGEGNTTRKTVNEAKAMAVLESNILIIGETGTGKELYAQSIHNYSSRGTKPFIGINCAAIPETLLEGILFGTTKGAFTGALDKSGLFEETGSGTVFLDELNSMPISMQTKLLRVLQERKFNRVGGTNLITLKCRVICAMNVDPEISIRDGNLRQDLYFRVAGLSLYLLPLREKKDELKSLIHHYIKKYNSAVGRTISNVSEELSAAFQSYSWPGNIRELEHVVENLMVRAEESDTILEVGHLPDHLRHRFSEMVTEPYIEASPDLNEALGNLERSIIQMALRRRNGNLTAASKDLGIIRQSLIYRMKRLGIERP